MGNLQDCRQFFLRTSKEGLLVIKEFLTSIHTIMYNEIGRCGVAHEAYPGRKGGSALRTAGLCTSYQRTTTS